MSDVFFDRPILNSPYEIPDRHWELDPTGQPTKKILPTRRRAEFLTPIPRPKLGGAARQTELAYDERSTHDERYHSSIITGVRAEVDAWRALPDPVTWKVTPETARLLQHWRHHQFNGVRPFFCQVEAVETAIWLTEVAPQLGKSAARFLEHLDASNAQANPGLSRLALKLATGAGKTTVMALLIAWQTINAVRRPASRRFTRGFLIVTPGLTIRDRLRVLQPNDPDAYYASRELVPPDLMPELARARIVITNFHAFKPRDRLEVSKGGRQLLQGRGGAPVETLETDGQMLQRVMPELMALGRIVAINDEAHHCYREKPKADDDAGEALKGDDRKEAEENNEAARLWIGGLEAAARTVGVARVFDLSATPFFLRGSGYVEGTLFPWAMSDFSLMDAIECGIVKLPRVPVADNLPGAQLDDMPMFRNLWTHIGKQMPRKGRGKGEALDPMDLPVPLQTALEALYGHYEKTFELWTAAGIPVPPCFIVVCSNTAASKLVHDFISGYRRVRSDGSSELVQGRLRLFRNFDDNGEPIGRPRTLLIDSEQLESGDALDDTFRTLASDEIERFRRERVERTGDAQAGRDMTDAELLREAMNTVGKPGRLGDSVRCVVSVSMLTEGWDTNTVTHVLGVRAFGTQLLCEQVVGRALRRQSYDLNADGHFDVEYADILGIPFDFTATPVPADPKPPRETVQVRAMRPDRDALEIRFPRVQGYRAELPSERLTAAFDDSSTLVLTPDLVGATTTRQSGIIGATVDLTLAHTRDIRPSSLVYELTAHLLQSRYRDDDGVPRLHLFGQLKRLVRQWLDVHLVCKGDTYTAQLRYRSLADQAAERIHAAITLARTDAQSIKAVLDPYNPTGTTCTVSFATSRPPAHRWQTDASRCHVNWAILDSTWEGQLCMVLERHPRVLAYVKNQGLGFEVPYRHEGGMRRYRPDFIVLVDDGAGADDPLHLVLEVKGYRGEDAKDKSNTMHAYWVPGVNALSSHGRWAFAELTDVWTLQDDLDTVLAAHLDSVLAQVAPSAQARGASSMPANPSKAA